MVPLRRSHQKKKKRRDWNQICLFLCWKTNICCLCHCHVQAIFLSSVCIYMNFFRVCETSIGLTPVCWVSTKGGLGYVCVCVSVFVKSCVNRGIATIMRSLGRVRCVYVCLCVCGQAGRGSDTFRSLRVLNDRMFFCSLFLFCFFWQTDNGGKDGKRERKWSKNPLVSQHTMKLQTPSTYYVLR